MKAVILFLLMVFPAFAQEAVPEAAKEKATEVADVKKDLPIAIIKTNFGDVTVEFYPEVAPKTVKNFIDLAEGNKEFTDQLGKKVKRPFFDGLIFHRVMKDFMIQGGCPQGTGTGDPGYRFEDEISAKALGLDKEKFLVDGNMNTKLRVYPQQQIQAMLAPIYQKLGVNSEETFKAKKEEVIKAVDSLTMEEVYLNLGYKFDDKLKSIPMKRGFLAMANSGPNTNGSQFFINLTDNRYLDGKHTVFAKVISGMDIVDKIGETKVQGSKPIDPVKIESIRLKK